MRSASSPFHDMQDHGNSPAASHSLSRSFASTTDPKAPTASARASRSQIIVLDVSSALAMAHPVAFGSGRSGGLRRPGRPSYLSGLQRDDGGMRISVSGPAVALAT